MSMIRKLISPIVWWNGGWISVGSMVWYNNKMVNEY